MMRLRSGLIGSMSAWLPSRRSTAHQRGCRRDALGRPGAVGQVDADLLVERTVPVDRHRGRLLGVLHGVLFSLVGWMVSRRRTPRRGRPGLGLVAAAKEKQTVKHEPRLTPGRSAGATTTTSGCRCGAASARRHVSAAAYSTASATTGATRRRPARRGDRGDERRARRRRRAARRTSAHGHGGQRRTRARPCAPPSSDCAPAQP